MAKKNKALSFVTPVISSETDLAESGGKLAFWKQILPKKSIHYTAKDGTRKVLNFDDKYLSDLANNQAVDKLGFILADKENAHTMDPERWRGEVVELQKRDDGLYGKIVFPNAEAAKAVLDNPNLGVSARIRENIPRNDGSVISRGLIHVLGTLDPQVNGMSPWEPADLSESGDDVLDLSDEEFEELEMAGKKKSLEDFTEADIDAMTEDDIDAFLAEFAPDFAATMSDDEEDDSEDEDDDEFEFEDDDEDEDAEARQLVGAGADMSRQVAQDIELANQRAASAEARANEALRRAAQAEWEKEREGYMSSGVPPHLLDLAEPVLCRADDMVIDLSNEPDTDDVNVSAVVRGFLDAARGTVDLSEEQGHGASFRHGDGDDPDAEYLANWPES